MIVSNQSLTIRIYYWRLYNKWISRRFYTFMGN